MTLSFWQQASREAELAGDVIVVGGGLIGCSTAYWLRQLRPALRVLLVEAQTLAAGASGRNAGFLLQGASQDYSADLARYGRERARRLWQFTRENRDLIFSVLPGEAFGLEASGSLTVAGTVEEDAALQAAVSKMRADGLPVAYLPPREANRRLGGQGFFGALYVPSGAMLDPVRLVRHLAGASEAQVLEGHPVVEVTRAGQRVRVETTRRRLYAGQVVLAMNAYLPQLFPELTPFVRPLRAQMLATGAAPRWLPVPAYTHEGYYYIRQLPDGTVLAGGARHLHREAEVGFEDAATPALQDDLEQYLQAYFPQARDLPVRQRWSGVMGFSPDHLPSFGGVPGAAGSYWAAGFSGHGLAYGFRFGRLMAELVLGYARPEGADLFATTRFETAPAHAPGPDPGMRRRA